MFRWYKHAQWCYVYLHDMPDHSSTHDAREEKHRKRGLPKSCSVSDAHSATSLPGSARLHTVGAEQSDPLLGWDRSAFRRCEWFSRGWTLQEMLAPRRVRFYSTSWALIAELSSLVDHITAITRIHPEPLTRRRDVTSFSIAQRFSWAAGRRTTRIEDRAYSLLGLLDVNMGIIYGEGPRAFERLQEELLRTSSDQTIFAFPGRSTHGGKLLAGSPDDSESSGDVIPTPGNRGGFQPAKGVIEFDLETCHYSRYPGLSLWSPSSWRHLVKVWLSVWLGSIRVKSSKDVTALLDCCLALDPTQMLVLRLSNPEGPWGPYAVRRGTARLATLDAHQVKTAYTTPRRMTFKVLRDANADRLSQYTITIVFRIEGKVEVLPDRIPPGSIWAPRSNALTMPFTRNRSELSALAGIPAFSVLVTLDQGRNHIHLRRDWGTHLRADDADDASANPRRYLMQRCPGATGRVLLWQGFRLADKSRPDVFLVELRNISPLESKLYAMLAWSERPLQFVLAILKFVVFSNVLAVICSHLRP